MPTRARFLPPPPTHLVSTPSQESDTYKHMTHQKRGGAPAAAAAGILLLLLALNNARPCAALLSAINAPLSRSSFRLSFRSLKEEAAVASAPGAAWRRYCFALRKTLVEDGGDSSGSGDGEGGTAADPAAPCSGASDACCSTGDAGPTGLAEIRVSVEAACAAGGASASNRTWWSVGPRARRAGVSRLVARAASGGGARPAFYVRLPAAEAAAWTETELCVHLAGERLCVECWGRQHRVRGMLASCLLPLLVPPSFESQRTAPPCLNTQQKNAEEEDNPCRTIRDLCGARGCTVLATTTTFARPGEGHPSRCFLSGTLPPVCEPACAHGGKCVAANTCDCAGTGYGGADTACSKAFESTPIASWHFCPAADDPAASPDTVAGMRAYLGAKAKFERCATRGGAEGCVVRFDTSNCSLEYRGDSSLWCDDAYNGSIVMLRGPSAGSPAPAALGFDGWTSLTVSAWVKPESVASGTYQFTIAHRDYGTAQFALGRGVGGTWDNHSARFLVYFECLLGERCVWPGDCKEFGVAGGAVPDDEWTHVVGTFGGGEVSVYVNGRRAAGPLRLPAPYNTAGLKIRERFPIFMGGHPPWSQMRRGQMDCVSFYREGLDAAHVEALYLREREACGCA